MAFASSYSNESENQGYSTEDIDRQNIDKLRRGSSAGDYAKFTEAASAATERASDNQATRDRESAKYAVGLGTEVANRDKNNKIQMMGYENALKERENASKGNDKDREMSLAANEKEKDREQQSFQTRAGLASQGAIAAGANDTNKDLAKVAQKTALAEQKSALERAELAAKAQVSSAILGKSNSYGGGYW